MNALERPARGGRGTAWILATLAVVLSLIVYYPITGNYFFGDDLLNLYRIVNLGFAEYVLRPYAGHMLLARNSIFYLCFELFGTQAEYYFYLVLVTHLVNVFLVFQVIRTFTHSNSLACFGAVLWGLSPMNEGTLGWYSVYGQVLVGTGVAWFLWEVARVADGRPMSKWLGVRLVLLLVVTSTMFGTGIGVAMAAPFAAFALLPPLAARRRLVLTLSTLLVVVPLLYFGLQHPTAAGFGAGGAMMARRLLSIPGTLSSLFLHLCGNGVASLLLGVWHDRAGYPSWSASLAIVGYSVALIVTFARGPVAAKRQIVACLLLASSSYAMIALGRGPMIAAGGKAYVFYRAARYQYFGPMLMAISLCTMLGSIRALRTLRPAWKHALLALSIALVFGSRMAFGQPIDHHNLARRLTLNAVSQIYKEIREAPGPNVRIRFPKQPFRGVGPMLIGKTNLFPGWAALFTIFFPDNTVDGKRVQFAVDDVRIIFAAANGLRTRDLFVMREDVDR